MTEITAPAAAEPFLFEGEYTATPQFADRLSAVSFRRSTLRRNRVVRIIVVAVGVAAVGYVSGLRVGLDVAALIGSLGLAVFGVLIFLTYLSSYVRGRSHLRKRFPTGSLFYLGLRERTLLVRTQLATTEISYAAYRACEPDGDFVFLRRRDTPISTIVPAECFTTDSLAWLTARIAATPTS